MSKESRAKFWNAISGGTLCIDNGSQSRELERGDIEVRDGVQWFGSHLENETPRCNFDCIKRPDITVHCEGRSIIGRGRPRGVSYCEYRFCHIDEDTYFVKKTF